MKPIQRLAKILGKELLAQLLHVKEKKLKEYLRRPDLLPLEVTDRTNLLLAIVQNLEGSYNRLGIRMWFYRRRSLLDYRAPIDFFKRGWWPRDPETLRVLHVAEALKG